MVENVTKTKEMKIWKAKREKPIEAEVIDEKDFEAHGLPVKWNFD